MDASAKFAQTPVLESSARQAGSLFPDHVTKVAQSAAKASAKRRNMEANDTSLDPGLGFRSEAWRNQGKAWETLSRKAFSSS